MSQDRHSTKTSGFLPQNRSIALVAMGSNLTSSKGDPTETIDAAVQLLGDSGWVIRAVSRYFRTPAFPAGSGPDFVNAALVADAPGDPAAILQTLHQIELALDRERHQRWAQRTIDLDLIGVGDTLLPDPGTHKRWRDMPLGQQMTDSPDQLLLPHPRVQDRAFVLVPLADVAPDWVHPALGLSVAQMVAALPKGATEEVQPLQ